MSRYYLVEAGPPYYALLTADEADELFESVSPECRHGSLGEGFKYWQLLENGLGQLVRFPVVKVSPIPDDQLLAVCERFSQFITLPEGLAR
jgi:hypothetical protein